MITYGSPMITGHVSGSRTGRVRFPHPGLAAHPPAPDARVYVIDDVATLARLIRAHPEQGAPVVPAWVRAPIDWPSVALDVDAVWLTERGQALTRFSEPSLHGWDCETVLWLRPAFTVGAPVALLPPPSMRRMSEAYADRDD